MGGGAFKNLPAASFPRLPPSVYESLKARLVPVLQTLYVEVTVPAEAPEKLDYGDLDLLVCTPRKESLSEKISGGAPQINVPHDQVKTAIGAEHCILEEGSRTSNFAVPVRMGEWSALGCSEQEEQYRRVAEEGEIYYQVDVHVCSNISEWERISFYHAYGDLGMIMGLVARNAGLHLGENGLKVSDVLQLIYSFIPNSQTTQYPFPPHPPVLLTDSFDDAMKFFGWSKEARSAGFQTRQEIFEWVITSHFFNAAYFRTSGGGIRKVKPDRTMYSEFVRWVELLASAVQTPKNDDDIELRREQARQEALVHFGKKDEVDSYLGNFEARQRLKGVFSGTNVSCWTKLGQNWKGVKKVMDQVRAENGGDAGLAKLLESEGEEALKQRVLKAHSDLSLTSAFQTMDLH